MSISSGEEVKLGVSEMAMIRADGSADPVLAPDLLLRLYAWALLKTNMPDVWSEANYGGLVPIVPLNEEPELDEFTGPHIVYGYTTDTTGDLWALSSGTMTFAIYDDNFRRLGKTINIFQTAFERMDEAARDVNNFTSAVRWPTDNNVKALLGIRFGCIQIGFVEGGTPEDQEGGRQSGLVNIRYDYFVDYGANVKTDILPS